MNSSVKKGGLTAEKRAVLHVLLRKGGFIVKKSRTMYLSAAGKDLMQA